MYSRFHEMHGFKLLPFADQWSEASIAGLGGSWGNGASNLPRYGTIAAGASYTVMHKVHYVGV